MLKKSPCQEGHNYPNMRHIEQYLARSRQDASGCTTFEHQPVVAMENGSVKAKALKSLFAQPSSARAWGTCVLERSSVLGLGATTTRFSGRVKVSSAMDLESRQRCWACLVNGPNFLMMCYDLNSSCMCLKIKYKDIFYKDIR